MQTDTNITSPWLTPHELASRWKITPKTLRLWRKAGKIQAYHLGRGVRFSFADIQRIEAEARA